MPDASLVGGGRRRRQSATLLLWLRRMLPSYGRVSSFWDGVKPASGRRAFWGRNRAGAGLAPSPWAGHFLDDYTSGFRDGHDMTSDPCDGRSDRQYDYCLSRLSRACCTSWLDFVHLGGVGEDVCELSVNCGWGFSAVGFQPRQCNISVGQPQHEVRRFRYVSNFCTKSSLA